MISSRGVSSDKPRGKPLPPEAMLLAAALAVPVLIVIL